MFTEKQRQHSAAQKRWRHLNLAVSTDREFKDALAELKRTAPGPTEMISPHRTPSGRFTCPLPASWRRWGWQTSKADCPEGSEVRIAEAKKIPRGAATEQKRLRWELAPDDPSITPFTTADVGNPSEWNEHTSHIHTEFLEHGHLVHIDVVAYMRRGPLRGYWEARIFIDGELAGRGGSVGCPPCSGSDLPAVAQVGRGKVIAVANGRQPWPGGSSAAFQRPVVTIHNLLLNAKTAGRDPRAK